MVSGIIGIIIGVIWLLSSLFSKVESAPQQTIQYLGFVCGSIFLIGGMILLKLHTVNDKLNNIEILKNYIVNNRKNINENISNIIFANISKDINLDEFDAYIQLNESESKIIYKILETNGRIEMNKYIKSLLKKYKKLI